MKDDQAFCIICGELRNYFTEESSITLERKGKYFTYDEIVAKCCDCGELLYLPEINDENVRRREESYYKSLQV